MDGDRIDSITVASDGASRWRVHRGLAGTNRRRVLAGLLAGALTSVVGGQATEAKRRRRKTK